MEVLFQSQMEVNQIEVNQMEVNQMEVNLVFKTQGEFEDLLLKVNFSLEDLTELYQGVHNIAYPVNFFRRTDHISQDIKYIVSQIPFGYPSISYGLLLAAIDDAIVRHPDFVEMEEDIPF